MFLFGLGNLPQQMNYYMSHSHEMAGGYMESKIYLLMNCFGTVCLVRRGRRRKLREVNEGF